MSMIPVVLTRKGAVVPKRPWPTDVAAGIRSAIDIDIPPGGEALIPTGLAISIPVDITMVLRPTQTLWVLDADVFPAPVFLRKSEEPDEMHVEVRNRGDSTLSIVLGQELAMATSFAVRDLSWQVVGARYKT